MMALVLFTITSCSSEKENKEEKESFPVVHPLIKDTTYTQEYVADIHSLQNVEIRARVKGFIEAVHVDEGKTVKEGQLLFSINSRPFKEELAKTNAALKSSMAEARSAELDLRNVKALAEKNVVAASDVEMAQAKLDAAQAGVEEAKANASAAELNVLYAEIRAPFDGIINRIPNKVGSLVDEGMLLTSISNNKDVFAYFYVSEKEYLDFRAENADVQTAEVSLVLANGSIYPRKGVIETVEGEIDKTTGNIAFRARFSNPDDLLKHGSNGKILFRKIIKAAMLVPQKSTFEVQDKTYLFLVDNSGAVHMQALIPKIRLSGYYIIAPTLKPEDRLIYEGVQHVKDGDHVNVRLVSGNDPKNQ